MFGSLKNFVQFSQFLLSLEECVNSIAVTGSKLNTFLVITPPLLHLIPLSMIQNLKPVFLVLKFSLIIKCFETKPPLSILLNTLISLSRIKKVGFKMHTGKRNPLQLPQNEQYNQLTTQLISGKIIHTQDKFLFLALNSSNNFATFDYEAHINTKFDYYFNHVFKSMSVVELNTPLFHNLLKKILLYPLNLLKHKPLLAPTPLLLKTMAFILKKNSNIFGILYFLLNTPIILCNSLVKLLVMNL